MLFELQQAPNADKIILQAHKMNRPIPSALADGRPTLFPWLLLFYNAFLDLIADRNWADAVIPWSARQRWAETQGLDRVATGLVHTHVKALDLAFLKWRAEKRKENEPPDGAKPGTA